MAQDSWPSPTHGAGALTEAEWERTAARYSDDGVYGDPTDTAVVVAGTGLQVTVKAEKLASLRGHLWYAGTTDYTHAISANASGSTRTDRVVLRLDRATWNVRTVIREGTPGAGAPALVQDVGVTGVYEIPLAHVSVLNGASAVTVTRGELYTGSRCRPCTSSTRPPSPGRGQQIFETDTGRWLGWSGSTWVTHYSDTGEILLNSTLSPWSITTDSVLWMRGGHVHLRLGSFERVITTLPSGTDSQMPLLIPAAYIPPARHQYALGYVTNTGGSAARMTIYALGDSRAGQVWLTQKPAVGTGESVMGTSTSWMVV